MIFNGPLLFETALLMLAAFLLGAVIGLALRWMLARPKVTAEKPVVAAAPAAAAAPELVKAPEIAPLPAARPSAAQRLAAAAAGHATHADDTPPMPAVKMPEVSLPEMPAIVPIAPSHVAGETVDGVHIDNPEHRHSASLDEVRAELVAQIETATAVPEAKPAEVPPPEPVAAADVVVAEVTPEPVAPAQPDVTPASDTPESEDDAPLLAEVSDEDSETSLPVEERVEPEVEATPIILTDAPEEVAEEIQDVVETTAEEPVPDVVAETPLVEPFYEKEEDEAKADRLFPEKEEAGDDELAAMRAIEGGWSPRRPATARKPADLPEGVSAAEIAAADLAVANSSAAVANATAMATAVLEEIAPARRPSRAGGFGRPASLDAPRDGRKDDFGQIKGLGPAIESALNGLGIYHYDQIADWDQKAVVWVENHFGFKGRIARERWQEQARTLARGRAPGGRALKR